MTDQEIVYKLIARDEKVTKDFLFKSCRSLFTSIINHIFSYHVDYEEFVNEFYLYLMENEAYRLRQFQGRSSIYQWLKIIAIRYFLYKRDRMIEMESSHPLSICIESSEIIEAESKIVSNIDINNLLSSMPNKRYVYVLRRLVLQEAEPKVVAEELKISIDNLYNIKKRAIAALTEVALKDVENYERK